MSYSNLKMKNDWLFVLPMADPEVVRGIYIPNTSESITQRGVVRYVKEGGEDSNIKLNDIVLFKKRNAFKVIEMDGIKFNVLKKSEILAIMFGDGVTDVTPTKDNVFLEWETSQSIYEGTMLIRPDGFREMHYTGMIVAIGPDVKECRVGDRVFFDQFGGVEKFQEDDNRYGFVKEDAIYCTGLPERKPMPMPNIKPDKIIWSDNVKSEEISNV